MWFLHTGLHEGVIAGAAKSLVLVKISDADLPPYLAFRTEELALYRLDKTGMQQHYAVVEFAQIDLSFHVNLERQALVFSSRAEIDDAWNNPQNFGYHDLLCAVPWPKGLN